MAGVRVAAARAGLGIHHFRDYGNARDVFRRFYGRAILLEVVAAPLSFFAKPARLAIDCDPGLIGATVVSDARLGNIVVAAPLAYLAEPARLAIDCDPGLIGATLVPDAGLRIITGASLGTVPKPILTAATFHAVVRLGREAPLRVGSGILVTANGQLRIHPNGLICVIGVRRSILGVRVARVVFTGG
jgi:hypothetical protein